MGCPTHQNFSWLDMVGCHPTPRRMTRSAGIFGEAIGGGKVMWNCGIADDVVYELPPFNFFVV